jgi:hypothetical protein
LVAALVSQGSLALLDFRALAVLLLQALLLAQILQQVSLLVLQRLRLPRPPRKHWVASPDSAGSLVSLGLVPVPLLLRVNNLGRELELATPLHLPHLKALG